MGALNNSLQDDKTYRELIEEATHTLERSLAAFMEKNEDKFDFERPRIYSSSRFIDNVLINFVGNMIFMYTNDEIGYSAFAANAKGIMIELHKWFEHALPLVLEKYTTEKRTN